MKARRRSIAVFLCSAVLAAAACGGGDEPDAAPAADRGAPVLDALQLLPDVEPLHRQVLFGDPGRLREVYGDTGELNDALAGLWPPDALAGAERPAWGRSYGFRLASVDSYVAAGFHPETAAVLVGRFKPAEVRAALRSSGYRRRGRLFVRGKDGSVDSESRVGRLALSSLDRVAVRRQRIVAASSTALARATLSPDPSLAADPDLSTAARAIGPVTAAVILPAELVRPATGVLVVPVAEEAPRVVAVGIDDRGASDRVFKVALVYGSAEEAEKESERLAKAFGDADVPTRTDERFSDLFEGLEADVVAGRAVLLQGHIADFELAGIWRALLETGDLAVLVPAR